MTPKKRWLLSAIGLVILLAGVGEIEAAGGKKVKNAKKNQHSKQPAKKNRITEKVVKEVNAVRFHAPFSGKLSSNGKGDTSQAVQGKPVAQQKAVEENSSSSSSDDNRDEDDKILGNENPNHSQTDGNSQNNASRLEPLPTALRPTPRNRRPPSGPPPRLNLENQTGRVLTSGLLYRPSTWLGAPVVVTVLSYISWQKFFAKKAKPENKPKPKTE